MNYYTLSEKEMNYLEALEKLKSGNISQKTASQIMKLTTRQVRNKMRAYLKAGPKSLVHGNRGRPSTRRWSLQEEQLMVQLLAGPYNGFNPSFVAEKMSAEYKVKVSRETVRKAMVRHGLWQTGKRKVKHRKWRERRSALGLMIQLDGSEHAWFETRGPKGRLLVLVDDATSRLMHLWFCKGESTKNVMQAMRRYIQNHGRPVSVYVDFGGVFSVNIHNAERNKITQFERAMKELSIEVIHAHSPQAKGRVERAHQTLQRRLIHEMRLANISSIQDANDFAHRYITDHNKRFAVQPKEPSNAHRSVAGYNLEHILCIKTERVIQNDFTIHYTKRILQLHQHQRTIIRPKQRILVHESLDGAISIWMRKTKLCFSEIAFTPKPVPVAKAKYFDKTDSLPLVRNLNYERALSMNTI